MLGRADSVAGVSLKLEADIRFRVGCQMANLL